MKYFSFGFVFVVGDGIMGQVYPYFWPRLPGSGRQPNEPVFDSILFGN